MYSVNVTESGYVYKHFDGVFQTKRTVFLILHHLKWGKMEFDLEVRDQRVFDELDDIVCNIFALDSDEEFE